MIRGFAESRLVIFYCDPERRYELEVVSCLALTTERPVAFTRSAPFPCYGDGGTYVEDFAIAEIMNMGVAAHIKLYHDFGELNAFVEIDRLLSDNLLRGQVLPPSTGNPARDLPAPGDRDRSTHSDMGDSKKSSSGRQFYYWVHPTCHYEGETGLQGIVRSLGAALADMPELEFVPVRWCAEREAIVRVRNHDTADPERIGGKHAEGGSAVASGAWGHEALGGCMATA